MIGTILIGVTIGVLSHVTTRVIDEKVGWTGPEGVRRAKHIIDRMPTFEIDGAWRDNSSANVRLWDAALAVRGSHLPCFFQLDNDCSANGTANALNYLQYVNIAQGAETEYHEVDRPWIYGGARVTIGKGWPGGPGTSGANCWAFVQQCGALAIDAEGVPAYSQQRSLQWGQNGPPTKFFALAKNQIVRTVSRVRSADEVRDAICSGYPCTVSSPWGSYDFGQHPRLIDGRLVLDHNGSWSHTMCIIGYDGETGREPYFYVINSWGEKKHGTPPDGAPPGGFWIRKKDVDFMTAAGDSYAVSAFDGFPARELQFKFLSKRKAKVPSCAPWERLFSVSL